jgi:hypothetical protein
MTKMATTMGPDFVVQFTDDQESAVRDFDFQELDAVILGRALSDADRERLRATIHAKNPKLVLLKSLAPIGGLIGEQVKAAVFEHIGRPPILTDLSYHRRHLRYALAENSAVDIVVYRFNVLFQAKSEPMSSGPATAGEQDTELGSLGLPGERFAVVTVNGDEKHIIKLR